MFSPKLSYLFNRRIVRFLMLPATLLLICPNCLAAYNSFEEIAIKVSNSENPLNNMRYYIGNNLKLTGFRLASDIYLGKARFDGGNKLSLVFDMGDYAYGISSDRINFKLRF